MAFSPDGRRLALGGDWGPLRIFDTGSGNQRQVLRPPGASAETIVRSVAWSPDGEMLAMSLGPVSGVAGASRKDRDTCLSDLAWSLTPLPGAPYTSRDWLDIYLPDLRSGRWRRWAADRESAGAITFAPDGKTLASLGEDGFIKLWTVATGKQRLRIRGTGGAAGKRHLRAGETGHEACCVAFSPDGKLLASGQEDGSVRFWDPATGKEVGRLLGHRWRVLSIAFSGDGKKLISGSDDGTALIWDVSRWIGEK